MFRSIIKKKNGKFIWSLFLILRHFTNFSLYRKYVEVTIFDKFIAKIYFCNIDNFLVFYNKDRTTTAKARLKIK
jgi:hypothetical protein